MYSNYRNIIQYKPEGTANIFAPVIRINGQRSCRYMMDQQLLTIMNYNPEITLVLKLWEVVELVLHRKIPKIKNSIIYLEIFLRVSHRWNLLLN